MTTHTFPFPPYVNAYWRSICTGTKGSGGFRAMTILSREARAYQERMKTYAAGATPLTGPVKLTIRVYRPRKIGDWDGTIKPLCDALQGVLYLDDAQIVEAHVYRLDDKVNPRVEVEITACPPEPSSSPARKARARSTAAQSTAIDVAPQASS